MAKRKPGAGRKTRAVRELLERTQPSDHILELRRLFSFVTPTKGPDGRVGEIDQDVCDALGQLHALGYFDGHGHDPQEMRDRGRMWGNHLALLLTSLCGAKVGKYERSSQSSATPSETTMDRIFDRMDESLQSYERGVLYDLIVTPLVGVTLLDKQIAPWAQAFIDEGLRVRGKLRKMSANEVYRFPDQHDEEMLAACIRGLCAIVDGGMEMRRAA